MQIPPLRCGMTIKALRKSNKKRCGMTNEEDSRYGSGAAVELA